MLLNWTENDVLVSAITTRKTYAYIPNSVIHAKFYMVDWKGWDELRESFTYEPFGAFIHREEDAELYARYGYTFSPMLAQLLGLEPITDSGAIPTTDEDEDSDEDGPHTCDECGEETDEDELTEWNGQQECESCLDGHTVTCEGRRCGERIETEDATEFDGSYYCSDCIDEVSDVCECCDERVSRDYIRSVDHGRYDYVCDSCYDNNYFYCDNCNETYPNYEYAGDGLCDSCSEDHDNEDEDYDASDDSNLVHGYSYRPTPNFYGNDPLFAGVELEVNSNDAGSHAVHTLKALNNDAIGYGTENHAYLKSDSSIGRGFEIVTHPHTFDEQKKLWSKFFETVPSGMTSYKSGNCGMHVHLTKSALTEMQIRRMLVFVNAPENNGYIAMIAQRSGNTYCEIKPKKLTDSFSVSRYEAINMTNSKTVEFRIFRGTVRKDRFYKNLEFVEAVVLYCAETNHEKLDAKSFIKWVKARKSQFKYLHNYHIEKGLVNGKPLATSDNRQPELTPSVRMDEAA